MTNTEKTQMDRAKCGSQFIHKIEWLKDIGLVVFMVCVSPSVILMIWVIREL